MDFETRQRLKDRLWEKIPFQLRKHVDTLRWFFYGARGAGRTYTAIVVALMAVMDGYQGVVIDHYPHNHNISGYIKNMIMEIANSVGVKVKIREQGNAYMISLVEEDENHENETR